MISLLLRWYNPVSSWHHLPNTLSLARIGLALMLLILGFESLQLTGVLLAIALAGLSDFLDGLSARWLACESEFGRRLDPCADAVFLAALGYITIGQGLATVTIAFIIIRYVSIALMQSRRIYLRQANVQALPSGKWTLAASMVLIVLVMLRKSSNVFSIGDMYLQMYQLWWLGIMLLSWLDYTLEYTAS